MAASRATSSPDLPSLMRRKRRPSSTLDSQVGVDGAGSDRGEAAQVGNAEPPKDFLDVGFGQSAERTHESSAF